jgi:hypothetical protein
MTNRRRIFNRAIVRAHQANDAAADVPSQRRAPPPTSYEGERTIVDTIKRMRRDVFLR